LSLAPSESVASFQLRRGDNLLKLSGGRVSSSRELSQNKLVEKKRRGENRTRSLKERKPAKKTNKDVLFIRHRENLDLEYAWGSTGGEKRIPSRRG